MPPDNDYKRPIKLIDLDKMLIDHRLNCRCIVLPFTGIRLLDSVTTICEPMHGAWFANTGGQNDVDL